MSALVRRLLCIIEMHEWRTVNPHWNHDCNWSRQECRHCKTTR